MFLGNFTKKKLFLKKFIFSSSFYSIIINLSFLLPTVFVKTYFLPVQVYLLQGIVHQQKGQV